MKYKDLIEKLLPFSDEEISCMVSEEKKYFSAYDDDPEYGDRMKTIDTVRFYHSTEDNNDIILSIEEVYDSESFETVGEAKITVYDTGR